AAPEETAILRPAQWGVFASTRPWVCGGVDASGRRGPGPPPHQPERWPIAADPVAFERLEAMALVQRRVPRVGVLEVGGDAAAVAAAERVVQQSAADPTTLMRRCHRDLEQVEVRRLRMPGLQRCHRAQAAA